MDENRVIDGKSVIDEYIEQDERLQNPQVTREIRANNLGLDFEKVLKIGKGTRETHHLNLYGKNIPIRLISLHEQRCLKHQCIIEMEKTYPYFKGRLYDINLDQLFLEKSISLATSSCIEAANIPGDRYLSEDDVGSLPPPTFAAIITEYQRIQLEYNPEINQIDDNEVDYLLMRLLDPTKKSIIMTGLTSSQMYSALSKSLDIMIGLEGITSIIDSLNSTSIDNQK
jgi:hypothetical protein